MKGWYKALEDLVWLTQLGREYAAAAGHVPGRCLVKGGEQLELANRVFLPAILLGLASGAQNFWYFAKGHLDRAKKEKPKPGGVQLTSVNITGGSPL